MCLCRSVIPSIRLLFAHHPLRYISLSLFCEHFPSRSTQQIFRVEKRTVIFFNELFTTENTSTHYTPSNMY